MASIEIIRDYFPGVLGRVTELHGQYYGQHWGFGTYFEARVAKDLAAFLERYDTVRDGLWTAALNGIVEGAIAIDGLNAKTTGAQLRWLIVSEVLQGTGLGRRRLNTAIEHCRERDYGGVYLHTFEGLTAARHLYEQYGFQLVDQTMGTQWGTKVREQKFLLEFQ